MYALVDYITQRDRDIQSNSTHELVEMRGAYEQFSARKVRIQAKFVRDLLLAVADATLFTDQGCSKGLRHKRITEDPEGKRQSTLGLLPIKYYEMDTWQVDG